MGIMGKNEGGQLVDHHGPPVNQEGQVSGGVREIFDLQNAGYEPKEIKIKHPKVNFPESI